MLPSLSELRVTNRNVTVMDSILFILNFLFFFFFELFFYSVCVFANFTPLFSLTRKVTTFYH